MVLLYFSSFLAMFTHIFGKSDQNMVVIVSNARQTTGNIASWQRTAHGAGLSRDLQCRQLNPCEKHGAGLSCGHHALKYKCLLVASHLWRMQRHLKLKDLLFITDYTTNVRTQLLGANTKSSELQHVRTQLLGANTNGSERISNKSESKSESICIRCQFDATPMPSYYNLCP